MTKQGDLTVSKTVWRAYRWRQGELSLEPPLKAGEKYYPKRVWFVPGIDLTFRAKSLWHAQREASNFRKSERRFLPCGATPIRFGQVGVFKVWAVGRNGKYFPKPPEKPSGKCSGKSHYTDEEAERGVQGMSAAESYGRAS